jgi:elongation factor Ts
MANITAADVKKLRDATGAGMMDCKKALTEANGNFDEAVAILRKKGQKVAEKRADRDSSEGVSVAKINNANTEGVVIVLGCETDFVGKNDDFIALGKKLANIALEYNDKESFLNADFDGITVADKLIEQTGVIGEKIQINDFKKLSAPYVGTYTHGNKIAVLVGLHTVTDNAAEVSKNVAMQVASMGATTLSYKDFDLDFIASETEARIAAIEKDNIERGRLGKHLLNVPQFISRAQLTDEVINATKLRLQEELKAEGKPEQIWDKILPGKLERFISDNTSLDQEKCLLDQKYIKDEKQNVADYVAASGNEVTAFAKVTLG